MTPSYTIDQMLDLIKRLPHTADGHPIMLGDTVYFQNVDRCYWGDEPVLQCTVNSLYKGLGFISYKGDFTVGTEDWEGGNLECWADAANVPISSTWG